VEGRRGHHEPTLSLLIEQTLLPFLNVFHYSPVLLLLSPFFYLCPAQVPTAQTPPLRRVIVFVLDASPVSATNAARMEVFVLQWIS
jgi:hypothetical protein